MVAPASETRQIRHHHAKAVIKRNRDAQPVFRTKVHDLARKVAIIENVVMRQQNRFWKAGGSRGKLDVNRIIGIKRGVAGGEGFIRNMLPFRHDLTPSQKSGLRTLRAFGVNRIIHDQVSEVGKAGACECFRLDLFGFRT